MKEKIKELKERKSEEKNDYEKGLKTLLEKCNDVNKILTIDDKDGEIQKFWNNLIEDINKNNIENFRIYQDKLIEINNKICRAREESRLLLEQIYKLFPPQISLESIQEVSISFPLDQSILELFQKKLLNRSETKNTDNEKEILQQIIDVLAQLLMPFGQHSNLSEAIDIGIEKIQYFMRNRQDNKEEIRNLMRETIEEYNFGSVINWSHLEESYFIDLLLAKIQNLEIAENSNIKNTPLYFIFQSAKELSNKSEKVEDSTKKVHTNKPLFEIIPLKEKTEKSSVDDDEGSSRQIDKFLQIPININFKKYEKIKQKLENHKDLQKTRIFLSLPEFVDLSYWCSPIEDQGTLNSCTAHAGIALMEYAEKKSRGTYTDASPLFLYKATRNLMQTQGDLGASVRDTMKAMVAFGVCPEQYWTYNQDKFDEEPTPFCYSFAENYKTLKYFRLDYGQISRHTLLAQAKVLLVSEIPCIFGFTLYNSVYDEANTRRGHIPLPSRLDKVIGGHTVVAVGYHDRKVIKNADGTESEGALLIRNSWGTRWGQGGYGWLPYDYVIKGLTADWWSLLKAEWLDTRRFGAGASAWNADKGDPKIGSGQ